MIADSPIGLWFRLGVFALILSLLSGDDVTAQKSRSSRSSRTAAEKEDKPVTKRRPLKAPVEVDAEELKTKDGVQLSATFYPGNREKDSIPVLLLHSWGGSREEFATLAPFLQAQGCAVLVPDLRGHGLSNQVEVAPEEYEELTFKRFHPDIYEAMVLYDLPQLKRFLMKENNKGQCNIDKMGLVGIEMGGLLAGSYANRDWATHLKRRKKNPFMGDVKGIVAISMPKNFSGLKFVDTLNNPHWNQNMSALFLSGEGDRDVERAKTLETQLRRMLRVKKLEHIYCIQLETSSQGAKLITDPDAESLKLIAEFVQERLSNREFPWENRAK
ncbi:MAG: alpha/beta fold hydrolase [Planctomycetia bacterium]|nr:alpha/beta fold hydrolase [Planctomycetia bacterium]